MNWTEFAPLDPKQTIGYRLELEAHTMLEVICYQGEWFYFLRVGGEKVNHSAKHVAPTLEQAQRRAWALFCEWFEHVTAVMAEFEQVEHA